jgi:hypothetical protein
MLSQVGIKQPISLMQLTKLSSTTSEIRNCLRIQDAPSNRQELYQLIIMPTI